MLKGFIMPNIVIKEKYNTVKFANLFIQATADLSILARKLLIGITQKVQYKKIDNFSGELAFNAKDIFDLVEKRTSQLRYLKDAIIELQNMKFTVRPSENPKDWHVFTYLTEGKYIDGKLYITINPAMRPYILELKREYTKYDSINIKPITNKHSLRIFELMAQYANSPNQTRVMEIKVLRKILGLENKYSKFPDFEKKVLKIAENELKERAAIYFSYELEAHGRKYTHIKFNIHKKLAKSLDNLKLMEIFEDERSQLIDELYENMTDEMLDLFDKTYGDEELRDFNYNKDGSPKELLMKKIIGLHFLTFPNFEEWKKGQN
ncbi:MAG TPA: replication initiation protein [Victivallales bacterium]|nr:replication initiation protein [Victivallales bacterium]